MTKWLQTGAIVGLAAVRFTRQRSRADDDAFDHHDWRVEQSALEFTKLRQQLSYYVAGLSSAILAYIGVLARARDGLGPWQGLIAVGALTGVLTVSASITSLVSQHESMMLNLRYSAQRRKPHQLTKSEMEEWGRANIRASRAATASLLFLAIQFSCVAIGMWAAAAFEPQALTNQLAEETTSEPLGKGSGSANSEPIHLLHQEQRVWHFY